ncbi:MAG: isoprenylcysteine carboxylmethyltransferase family protein [Pseudomonadales bacterium]|nr:isoprenylcysteine carboxylmethyltransferase family protein [Pseudomonadales bacterium]
MQQILTLFLPLYFLLFFGFAFLWRSWRTYRLTGVNPYRLLGNPGPEEITSRYFRLLPFLSLLVMVVYLLPGRYYEYLAPFRWLHGEVLQTLGLVIMSVALVIIVIAQGQMGESWRIGVDYDHRTEFVRQGLFKYSRNPIFAGVMLSVIGYFLVLPNAVTLLIMTLDLVLIQIQIRLEEQHLAAEHGDVYKRYCDEVRRWV